jgi:tRNA modification GTPase
MNADDTIAAISTPAGEGGIGIVRLSGPGALSVARAVFRLRAGDKSAWPPAERYLHYGAIHQPGVPGAEIITSDDLQTPHITPPHGASIDDGFLVYMLAPASYTGEDVVELHCHGGSLVTARVLDAVLSVGARIAEPGEFTRRAFVNGRMDLVRAEAVIDVIRAETDSALASARGRLDGHLSAAVNRAKEILTGLLVRMEAELDFPEEDEVEGMPSAEVLDRVEEADGIIKKLIESYSEGRALKDGVRTVILGRTNVGKSSLLNLLLCEERAIVTPVPGTTRDVIEEVVNIRGLPVRLMDTAGLRDTVDRVEAIGVERARERAEAAQVVLFVVDTTTRDFTEDLFLLSTINVEGKNTIIVSNKADLAGTYSDERTRVREAFSKYPVSFVSALRSIGIEEFKDYFYNLVTGHDPGAGPGPGVIPAGEMVTSLRHKQSLERAREGMERVGRRAAGDAPLLARELVATDLRESIDCLGEITGETTTEDILDRIFSDFCIGK